MDDPRLEKIKEDADQILATIEHIWQGKTEGSRRVTKPIEWFNGVYSDVLYQQEQDNTPGGAYEVKLDEWSGGAFHVERVESQDSFFQTKVIRWQPMPDAFEGDA
jgi:hypothetical protein